MTMRDEELLSSSLKFVSEEARHWVLDAIAAELSNEAGTLIGNTAESDIRWFARELWARARDLIPGDFDRYTTDEAKAEWDNLARAAISATPALMSRIGHRMQAHAKAFRTLERASRLERNSQLGARLGRPA